jgi:hypothetical protein
MRQTADKPFDWIAALAVASGIFVMLPSLAALVWAVFSSLAAMAR